jgi:hypothetical protein
MDIRSPRHGWSDDGVTARHLEELKDARASALFGRRHRGQAMRVSARAAARRGDVSVGHCPLPHDGKLPWPEFERNGMVEPGSGALARRSVG